ncbi:hypothetical protein EJB05_49918, partial [Eragrostis curvula]
MDWAGAGWTRRFSGYSLWLADVGPRRQELGQCNGPPFEEAKRIALTTLSSTALSLNVKYCVF